MYAARLLSPLPFCVFLLASGETEAGGGMVLFAGAESCRRPRGVVGCIRIVLGLETDSVAETIDFTPFARDSAVEEITRIDLNTRFCRQYIEGDTRSRAIECGSVGIVLVRGGIQHPVVVVAVSVTELDVVGVDVLPDGFGRRIEIKGRTRGNVGYLARGHKRTIDGRHTRGIEPKGMRENIVVAVAREVEIGVVGHIDDRGGIGGGGIVHMERVVVGEGVGTGRYDIAGETVVAIGGVDREAQGMSVYLLCLIDLVLPARGSAVEGMTIVVGEQLVGRTVDSNTPVVETVGIPPDTGTEIGRDSLIVTDIVETEYYIPHSAGAVGYKDRNNTSAEVGNTNLHTIGVGEGIEGCGLILAGGSEPFWTEP